ncbi:MAG: hypothetical protein FJ184_00015 [Gammaproteobacteria bacterium]|nr:hypothetical protein [Gammaproteobacteria bacterium]
MSTRAIFNRKYESFTPGTTEVWLVNGAGVATTPATVQNLIAGATFIQGDAVYVSGTYALPATAASGVNATSYNAVGITASSASSSSTVDINVDGVAVLTSANLVGETQLTPGQYYYLSKYDGKLTKYATSSGLVTAASGYAALVYIGQALSPTELQIEIEPPVVLFD